MAFGLTIGTERATVLQQAIQDELTKRGYSPDADPVMAEYITIMIINNKTPSQISAELEDLIGSEFDSSFVDWLFAEVAKSAPEAETTAPVPEPTPAAAPPVKEPPPHLPAEPSRRLPNGPRTGPLYQQALAQALPSTSPSGQKRPASARSPSPGGHVHKQRRMDLPTGPRAMQRERDGTPGGSRSLLERMSSPRNGPFVKDDIQARIDTITGSQNPEMGPMMMGGGPGPFPMNGMPGMDMAAMAGMTNPLVLQEMMMNQMALMSQMAGAMGILNPAMGMNGPFPMQPGMDMNMMNGMNGQGMDGRGRGRGRGGMRGGRGRGGHTPTPSSHTPDGPGSAPPRQPNEDPTSVVAPAPVVAGPIPTAAPQITHSTSESRPGFNPPERPQSPTLCKFALKCTNPSCRYSHPSPVATPESGVVLSNDPCENGKNCKDKDCIRAHVSPAVLKATGEQLNPKAPVFTPASAHPSPAPSHQSQIPCRFGTACTRPGCSFMHPSQKQQTPIQQPCRFGTGCTKATCQFQHPEGRVLPSSFHRGLSTTGGLVSVAAPEPGSISGSSHNKSMTFNKPNAAAELERKVKEVEERKLQAQQAVAQAQAAAASGKKDDAKPVTISA